MQYRLQSDQQITVSTSSCHRVRTTDCRAQIDAEERKGGGGEDLLAQLDSDHLQIKQETLSSLFVVSPPPSSAGLVAFA